MRLREAVDRSAVPQWLQRTLQLIEKSGCSLSLLLHRCKYAFQGLSAIRGRRHVVLFLKQSDRGVLRLPLLRVVDMGSQEDARGHCLRRNANRRILVPTHKAIDRVCARLAGLGTRTHGYSGMRHAHRSQLRETLVGCSGTCSMSPTVPVRLKLEPVLGLN